MRSLTRRHWFARSPTAGTRPNRREIATAFNAFYRDGRIAGEGQDLATARLHLAHATRQTLANGLTVLGIDAPDRM